MPSAETFTSVCLPNGRITIPERPALDCGRGFAAVGADLRSAAARVLDAPESDAAARALSPRSNAATGRFTAARIAIRGSIWLLLNDRGNLTGAPSRLHLLI